MYLCYKIVMIVVKTIDIIFMIKYNEYTCSRLFFIVYNVKVLKHYPKKWQLNADCCFFYCVEDLEI